MALDNSLLGRLVGRSERCKPGTTETFSRFSGEAREVLELAQTEARALDHNYFGTEHILQGLLGVERGLAARVLASPGIGVEQTRAALAKRFVGRGPAPPPGPLLMTPRSKKVLDLACRCSFCEREGIEVAHLVAGPGVFICERCVDGAGDFTAGEAASGSLEVVTEEGAACSFCGKGSGEVAKLVAGPHALICDGCVAPCREIQDEEGRR